MKRNEVAKEKTEISSKEFTKKFIKNFIINGLMIGIVILIINELVKHCITNNIIKEIAYFALIFFAINKIYVAAIKDIFYDSYIKDEDIRKAKNNVMFLFILIALADIIWNAFSLIKIYTFLSSLGVLYLNSFIIKSVINIFLYAIIIVFCRDTIEKECSKEYLENKNYLTKSLILIIAFFIVVIVGIIWINQPSKNDLTDKQHNNIQQSNKINTQLSNNNEIVENEEEIIKKIRLYKYEDIIVEAAYIDEYERLLIYTRKDKNNKIIWTYKTGTEIEAQYRGIQTSKITTDRIYIDEHGTITVLNKKTGKPIWNWKYCEADDVVELAYVEYVDEQKNTYVTYGKDLTILDKDGKVELTTTYNNIDLTDSHCSFIYIGKTEGIVLGNETFAIVNLNDYSTKLTGEIFNDSWCDENEQVRAIVLRNEGTDGLLLTGYVEGEEKWAYRTNMYELAQCESFKVLEVANDRVYLDENGSILVFNKENGKIIWKNSDAKDNVIGSHYLDREQNLYIYYGEQVNVFDKDGKIKAVIKHECLGGLVGEGIEFKFINENELVLEAMAGRVTVSLEDYSIIKCEDNNNTGINPDSITPPSDNGNGVLNLMIPLSDSYTGIVLNSITPPIE